MKLTFVLLTAVILNVSANGLSQKVSFVGKDVSLKKVFAEIEKQTGYAVTYTSDILIGTKPVTVNMENSPLHEFLEKILIGQPIKYTIGDKTILLARKANLTSSSDLNSITNVLMPLGDVRGRVINENGEPVPGATVMVKGTTNGTATDENGNYNINVPNQSSVLIFSSLGFQTQEIKVGNQSIINITFKKNIKAFDEIVIAANLVESRKREVASAVTTITSTDIEKLPINTVDQLFRTEVPGGFSWSNGPGSYFSSIQLRGADDFVSSADAVKIFVDGFEVTGSAYLSTLSLSSIDHIEILRGPQASTLYGSGAASGVVYIFTKKGKGGLHINAKASAGTIASRYVDKTAYQYDHSLNISGGSENLSYNAGGSYLHFDPYWENAGNTATSTFGSVKAKQGNLTVELTGQYGKRRLGAALNPILKSTFPSVPSFANRDHRSTDVIDRMLGINLVYTPFSWWQNNIALGNDYSTTKSVQTEPNHNYSTDTLNLISESFRTMKSYRYYTTLKIPTGDFFKTTVTAGISHYNFDYTTTGIRGTGVGKNFVPVNSTYTRYNQLYSNTGWFAQAVFGFADKFFITTGVRSERTKSYGVETKASIAPRVGASFVAKLGETTIKPRISYGKSIKVPDPSQTVEIITDYPDYGFTFIQLANPNLKPQEQVGFDMGIDAEFGNGLGSFEATYYNQAVNNFITVLRDDSDPVAPKIQFINLGKIKNTGFEFAGTLNANPFKFKFTYSILKSIIGHVDGTGYESIYSKGDRLWGVPKSSGSATITYAFPSLFKSKSSKGGSISLGTTYIGDWISTDLIAQNTDYYVNYDYSHDQKYYNMNYKGYALFRLGVNYSITKNFEAFLTVDNLFNSNEFEYDNSRPIRGRLTMLGIRINY